MTFPEGVSRASGVVNRPADSIVDAVVEVGQVLVDVAAAVEGAVRCVTPSARERAAGAVAVHLVHDDAVVEASVAFTYYAAPAVSSVEPVVGFVSGGTLVQVGWLMGDVTQTVMR